MSEMTTGGPHRDAVPTDVDLERVWTRVAAEVWQRDPGWLERFSARLLRSPGLARALLTHPVAASAVADRERRCPWCRSGRDEHCWRTAGGALGPGAGRSRHRLRLRAGHRSGLGAFAEHGRERPDGAARAGARGVRRGRGAWARGVGRIGKRGWDHVRLAGSDDRGFAARARRGNARPAPPTSASAAGLSAWCITVLAGKAADGRYSFAVTDHALYPDLRSVRGAGWRGGACTRRGRERASPTRTLRGMS